jgi:hypothetical protein
MDWNIGVSLETQSHVPVLNREHGDFDHALKAYRSSNYNRFIVFSGQDQHGIASIRITDVPHPESAMQGTFRIARIRKKPTWSYTLGYSTTSAYLLTRLSAWPGCASSSLPMTWALL